MPTKKPTKRWRKRENIVLFSSFSAVRIGEEITITFINNFSFKERKQNLCFGMGFFFCLVGVFLSLHACLSNIVTWGLEHCDPLFSDTLQIWNCSPFTSRIKDFTMFHTSYSGKPRQNKYISRADSQSSLFFRHLTFNLGVRKRELAREIHISTCLAHKHNFVFPAMPESCSECNCTSEWITCFKSMSLGFISAYPVSLKIILTPKIHPTMIFQHFWGCSKYKSFSKNKP